MDKRVTWLPVLLAIGLISTVLSVVVLIGGMSSSASACPTGTGSAPGAVPIGSSEDMVPGWDAEQTANADAIIAAGAELGVPLRAQTIAVMTAIGESGLRILDYGDDAGPDSRGLFQQRDNGAWGTYEDRMDPRTSSINFYRALLQVPGWQELPPTTAAHQTQHNADPYYYEPFFDDAVQLVEALTDADSGQLTVLAAGGNGTCDNVLATGSGTVVYPVPPSFISADSHNWGGSGGNWASWHTGTDFSVPCGTPVIAATSGTVEIDTTSSWAGRWLVKVSTGPGKLSTWYAHMQALSVTAGQVVSAGQVLGEVGAEGNATGCHLHFEVHTAGGSIYGPDNVNPSDWLAANVGTVISGPVTPPPPGSGQIQVMTYNAARGADHGRALDALADEIAAGGASIVVLNELDNRNAAEGTQADYLGRKLGMYVAYGPNATLGGVERGNAILSKYPMGQANNTPLPVAPGTEQRGLLRVLVNVDGTVIQIAASHLHFTGDIRLTQARAISAALGSPSCTTFLMGDMNSTPGSPMHAALTTNLRDTFGAGNFGEGLTSPAGAPRNRIDYIFYSTQTAPVAAQVLPRGFSDHRGVVAVFPLNPDVSCA